MEEDNVPLLQNVEDEKPAKWTPANQVRELLKNQRKARIRVTDSDLIDAITEDQINVTQSYSQNDAESPVRNDVIAVFVVAFDTRCGNVVEWCFPEDIDLETVEFKAMPSGAHTVDSDFLYFVKGTLFGLSCFEKIAVCSQEERGVRMKSVGVLANSYTSLHRYMQFLEHQVRHQLENPQDYQQLVAFYEDNKGVLPLTPTRADPGVVSSLTKSRKMNELPPMTITHPAGCFMQFVRFFGENVFALWKLTLLQKRVLFFSPPPIGLVCYRVYCTACLAKHSFSAKARKIVKPYFYVNIADIEHLETEITYIACTTEKVFEEKKHLYDVYVDNRILKTNCPAFKDILKINQCDQEKYSQLVTHRQEHLFLERIGEAEHQNEEQMFISFFTEQNNRLFQTLFDVASSEERTLTTDHMRAMGLHPVADRQFIMMMLELYKIDVLMVIDNPCCPI